ncbi:MAG: hypothetical protein ACRD0K_09175 [Egibacteraceae bacterium]
MLSKEHAAVLKQALRADAAVAQTAPKIWNYFNLPDPYSAADFANLDPAQGAGEAVFTNRPDGTVDVYLYF